MSPLQRTAPLLLLPLLTLAMGWQLGTSVERRNSLEIQRQMELRYTGNIGSGAVIGDPEKNVDISLLWSVWRLLQSEYIDADKLQTTPLLYGAVRGLVNAVEDPYTVFMTPKENQEFHDALSGQLQGIGAELAVREEKIVVVSPIKGSPAEKAGLMPDDELLEVDTVTTEGKTLQEVVTKIRGKKGTKVTILVKRKDVVEPISMTITRDDIRIPSVESEVKKSAAGDIGVISINQFGDETIKEVTKALQDFEDQALKGMVIDLRYNGGGYLDGAVELTSLFLKQGKVVSVEGTGTAPQNHYVSGRPTHPDVPLVVLINQGTASASEIFAGALQDHERAKIIGMKSFGKGTVQEVVDLPGGSSLRVTVAHWLTPDGKNLSKEGVTPDIEIDRTPEDIEAKKDPQMDSAVKWLLEGK